MSTRRRRDTAYLIAILCSVVLTVRPAAAQNENETVGFQTNHAFESGLFGENIDVLNGGLSLTTPIGPKYQVSQSLSYGLSLVYASKVWERGQWDGTADLFRRGSFGLGFRMHFGRIYRDVQHSGVSANCTWVYVSPDGNEHALDDGGQALGCSFGPQLMTTDTTYMLLAAPFTAGWDGNGTAPTLTITTPEGMSYEFGRFVQVKNAAGDNYNSLQLINSTDTQHRQYNRDFGGWYVTRIEDARSPTASVTIEYVDGQLGYEHLIQRITDAQGRMTEFFYQDLDPTGTIRQPEDLAPPNDPKRYSIVTRSIEVPAFTGTPGVNGTRARYEFLYYPADRSIRNTDYVDPDGPGPAPGVKYEFSVRLREIVYPCYTTHTQPACDPNDLTNVNRYRLTFGYNEWGELNQRTLPTGAAISYAWEDYSYLGANAGSGNWLSQNASRFTRQVVSKTLNPQTSGVQTWTYTRDTGVGPGEPGIYTNPPGVTVRDPLGNETKYFYRASRPSPQDALGLGAEDGYAPEWNDGTNYRADYYQGLVSGGKLLRTESRDYEPDRSGDGFPDKRNVRVSRVVTTYGDDGGRQSVVAYSEWDGAGHWKVTSETGYEVPGTRITRREYFDLNPSHFHFEEVREGGKVLSRIDNKYEPGGWGHLSRLERSVQRVAAPPIPETPVNTTANAGDILTCYLYDNDGNVQEKKVTANADCNNPDYRIAYTWNRGYLTGKQFYRSTTETFTWKAIDRVRDGNTGLIFTARDSAGVPTGYVYDELGRLKDIVPASPEHPTQIEYLSILQTSVRQGDPAVMGSDFACAGGAGDFIQACYRYDTLGRLRVTQKRPADPTRGMATQTSCTDALGRTTYQSEWQYVPLGQAPYDCAQGATPPPGTIFDYRDPAAPQEHDPFNRLRLVTTADGKETRTDYFGLSSKVTVRGVQGKDATGTPCTFDSIATYFKDGFGRLVYVLPEASSCGGSGVQAGAHAMYQYDLRDNLTQVDLVELTNLTSQTRSFEYDALNRLRSATHPESGAEVIAAYDALGNVTEAIDSTGAHLLTTYDRAGRVLSVKRREYQKPGEPAAPGDPPTLLVNTYHDQATTSGPLVNANGKLIQTEDFDDTGALLLTRKFFYQRLNGRLSSEESWFSAWSGPLPLVYEYNNFGLPSLTTYPEGAPGKGAAFTVVHAYSNGHPVDSRDLNGSSFANGRYNAAGGFEELASWGGMKTFIEPDTRNRPGKITIGKWNYSTSAFLRVDLPVSGDGDGVYEYDGAGNILRIGLNRYAYDGAQRLVQADTWYQGTNRKQSFAYDDYGNLIQKRLQVGASDTIDSFALTDEFAPVNTNRLVSHKLNNVLIARFVYDGRGNLIGNDDQTYDYDGRNRMVLARSLAGVVTQDLARYGYDAGSTRILKTDVSRELTTFFVRDGQGRLMSEFRRTVLGSHTPEWSKHYIYLGDRMIGLRENVQPGPPGGLTATTQRQGSTSNVTLFWTPNPAEEGVTGYKVWRAIDSIVPIWTLAGTATQAEFTDQNLSTDMIYDYQVTAVRVGGESYASSILVVTAGDNTDPSVPAGLSLKAGDRRVDLTWTPNAASEDVAGYHVYRNESAQGQPDQITQVPTQDTKFSDLNLQNETTYYYSLKAVDIVGRTSARSAEQDAMPKDYLPPGPPQGVKVTGDCQGGSVVTLSWEANASTDVVRRYWVYRSPDFTPTGPRPVTDGISFTDSNTTAGQIYYYWVVAEDDHDGNLGTEGNRSAPSLQAGIAAPSPAALVPPPKRPSARARNGEVTLRVPAPDSGSSIKAFRAYRKANVDDVCGSYEYVGQIQGSTDGTGAPLGRCLAQACPDGTCPNGWACTLMGYCATGGFTCRTNADCATGSCEFFSGWSYRDFEDQTPPSNVAYDYAFTHVDVQGRESGFSPPALAIPVQAVTNYRECIEQIPNVWTPESMFCNATLGRRRLVLRWDRPPARPYQPLLATNTDGTLGYLKGYRLYSYSEWDVGLGSGNPDSTGDFSTLMSIPIDHWLDYAGNFCANHPDVPCYEDATCPAGDTCGILATANYGTCCLNGSGCGGFCQTDSDCPSGKTCDSGPPDRYLVMFRDGSAHVIYDESFEEDCLAVKAVYKVYAHGNWVTVESDFNDNLNTLGVNPRERCREGTKNVCQGSIPPDCPTNALPPSPAAPIATIPTTGQPPAPVPNSIRVSWSPPQGASGIAGYYLYMIEKDRQRFHAGRNLPFLTFGPGTTSHTFTGLSRCRQLKLSPVGSELCAIVNEFTFRVAAFDTQGRISEPSPHSSLISPAAETVPIPPPRSLKTVIWTVNDSFSDVAAVLQSPVHNPREFDGVKLAWKWDGYWNSNLLGFKIWRSDTPGGPYTNLTPTPVKKRVYADTTAQNNRTYYYVLTTVTTSGESAFSEEVAARPLTHGAPPLSPPLYFKAYTRVEGANERGIYLQWCRNPPQENITEYRVYRAKQSGGPYKEIARLPLNCLDGSHRCTIGQNGQVSVCAEGPGCCESGMLSDTRGNCRVVDSTVFQPTGLESWSFQMSTWVYYYVVTAVRGTEESAYSAENQGWPIYCSGTTCYEEGVIDPPTLINTPSGRYDPDNFPDFDCGDENVRLDLETPPRSPQAGDSGEALASFSPALEAEVTSAVPLMAPYRVVGIRRPPGGGGGGGGSTSPNALPRLLLYHLDHLGSPRVITDSLGNVVSAHHYMPFGEEIPSQAQNSRNTRQFTGHERDAESGLDYMVARYYASSLGRFLTVDEGESLYLEDPQSWNAYSYVRNNPISLIDPNGLEPIVPATVVNYFPVTGNTVAEAWASAEKYVAANSKAPVGSVAWTHAVVSYDADISYSSDGSSVTASNSNLAVTVTTTVNLPKWIAPPDSAPGAQQEFNSQVQNEVKPHEQTHVGIAIEGGRELEKALKQNKAKGKTRAEARAGLVAKNRKTFSQNFAQIEARQKEFDASRQVWQKGPSYGGSTPRVMVDGVDVGGV